MSPTELRAMLHRLKLTQLAAAHLLGVDEKTVRRWVMGKRSMPQPVVRLLWACERYPGLLDGLAGWERVA